MARIAKEEHPRILQMVQDEGRKVLEVAAQYGCTPANIYAILAKLRQADGAPDAAAPTVSPVDGPLPSSNPAGGTETPEGTGTGDLFRPQSEPVEAGASDAPTALPPPAPAAAATSQLQPQPALPTSEDSNDGGGRGIGTAAPDTTRQSPPARHDTAASAAGGTATGILGATRARPAKPGVGLCMRNADGDESVAPFRSLDDLFSALRPLLRTVAKSPEPVWFCVKPVDLAETEGSDI